MPGLTHRNSHSGNSSSSALGSIGQKVRSSSPQHGIDPSQLHKFWNELSLPSRRDLLRIDKHTLFEQVRKNMYCSRCNGLLLEGFSQIIVHGKNLQGGSSYYARGNAGDNREASDMRENTAASDARDPSVHPWGGLTATRDSMLTLLECFFNGQSLEVLQNVFDCARARERERELLYPDACGGGGRGWISQGNGSTSFSRGYSLKETCALHTARLSCDALVDFWSALGDETRRSLLRMKEEDFIARLMYRFDSKRFCRDCRRNVLREFKELKELKRTRKEPRCTRWFCTADTAFRYEVTNTSVLVNWRECFEGDVGNIYQHFEWALGSAEGTSDILEFEDVGFSEGARVDGLDLSHVSAFYITLRAWKHDGRCTEISVKAHALKGQQCVHRRLIVGDGYVAITKGESIKRFFEHAEEAEEEEDDDGMDKDGSETESEGSRFQKHAKSPELAREFLLDAATVIFKEQVEKAFREGTARQNAHTTFVCLALSLLEERIYVACKEISTLEKQNKLLEEEEHEKREEEQRRERKRLKEKEKKMRRKEKLKGKQKDKEKVHEDTDLSCKLVSECNNEAVSLVGEHENLHEAKETCINDAMSADSAAQLSSTDRMVAESSCETTDFNSRELHHCGPSIQMDGCDDSFMYDNDGVFIPEQTKEARKRTKIRKGPFIETVSRRLVRRRAVMALESGVSARGFFKLSCEPPPREMAEKAIPKHNKVSSNHDRNTHSSWPERWNPRQLKKQNPQDHVSPCSRNSSCVTGKHNDGKDSVVFKRSERKAAVAVGYKQGYGAGKSNPGTVQFNWQVIKSRVSVSHNGVKRGDQSPDKGVSSEIPSSKQSCLPAAAVSASHDHVKPPLVGLKRDHSTTLGSDLMDSSLVEHRACNSESSGTSSTGEDLNNELEPSRCATEASDSSGSPPAELEIFSLEKPLRRLAPGCLTETIDEDSSPSSGASCVTDTSDGLTSDSMITESSCLEGGFTSQSTLRSEFSAFVPNELQEPCYNGDGFTHNTNILSGQAGEYYAFTTGSFPHPDLYSYSCSSSVVAYSNGLPCGYMHDPVGANPEGAIMTVEQQICQVDTSMQLPVITGPVLPAYQAEHYGYPWIQGPCEAVPHPDLLPLSHPSSLVLHNSPAGFSSSHGGLSSTYLSMPPPFQPMHQVLNFPCLPAFTPEATPMQWRDDQLVFGNQQEVASGPDSRYDCYQDESCDKEQMSTTTSLLDAQANDGFSFFHFGALPRSEEDTQDSSEVLNEKASSENLRVMKTSCRSKLQEGIQKLDIPVDEYSLFAATPGKRFSFF